MARMLAVTTSIASSSLPLTLCLCGALRLPGIMATCHCTWMCLRPVRLSTPLKPDSPCGCCSCPRSRASACMTACIFRRSAYVLHPWQVNAQYLTIQKHNGAQRLIVRRCRDMALIDQHGQERFHFGCTHVTRMAHDTFAIMPTDEKAHPIQVRFLGAEAIVEIANALAQLVEQPRRVQNRLDGFHGLCTTVHLHST